MSDRSDFSLGADAPLFDRALADWASAGNTARLWIGDATLWTDGDESRWLGWLTAAEGGDYDPSVADALCGRIARDRVAHVVVLGMGGSSLCPDVVARTLGADTTRRDLPALAVWDSTVPAQVHAWLDAIDPSRTLFVVSSKSGSTIEPNALFALAHARVAAAVGADRAAERFVAITDPGSSLETLARESGFAAIAYGVPSIGGRFSALSSFGLLPAALIGVDTEDFLGRARAMAHACAADVPAADNPGVALGLAIASLAAAGRDKLTLVVSPGIATLGAWLEQLVAESTGKHGRGVVPIADERVAAPEAYGDDRLFAYVRLASAPSPEQDAAVDALERAGHPVARLHVAEAMDLGAEFFRWEIATATAGAALALNPFDQPDVEAAKVAARALMREFEQQGALPPRTPLLAQDGVALYADPSLDDAGGLDATVAAHLERLAAGDYFAVNAYLARTDGAETALARIRHAVRDARRVATSVGYGPRFLHSTGQLHKGGPNTGVFLQVTAKDRDDLEIPGARYSFGVLASAQAQGDFDVLVDRERRALWAELDDVETGLPRLVMAVERALRP